MQQPAVCVQAALVGGDVVIGPTAHHVDVQALAVNVEEDCARLGLRMGCVCSLAQRVLVGVVDRRRVRMLIGVSIRPAVEIDVIAADLGRYEMRRCTYVFNQAFLHEPSPGASDGFRRRAERFSASRLLSGLRRSSCLRT